MSNKTAIEVADSNNPLPNRPHTRKKRTPTFYILAIVLLIGVCVAIALLLTNTHKENASLSERVQALRGEKGVFENAEGVFVYQDRTFVPYDESPITATIYTSTSCDACADDVQKIALKLRTTLPTIEKINVIDVDEGDNRSLAEDAGVAYLPGVAFSKDIENSAFFTQGKEFFGETDAGYVFYAHSFGHPPREYISSPVGIKGFTAPAKAASVESVLQIHAFLTTDCASCKTMNDVLGVIENANPKVTVIRHFSESREEKEYGATKALACATELGEGDRYASNLYLRQAAWKATEAASLPTVWSNYAANYSLDATKFTDCMTRETLETVEQQDALFEKFGIVAVPTIFIGDTPLVGVQTVENVQAEITAQTKS